MSFYGQRYESSVRVKIARVLERAGVRMSWRDLLRLAGEVEAIVRRVEQDRYEDWRD